MDEEFKHSDAQSFGQMLADLVDPVGRSLGRSIDQRIQRFHQWAELLASELMKKRDVQADDQQAVSGRLEVVHQHLKMLHFAEACSFIF